MDIGYMGMESIADSHIQPAPVFVKCVGDHLSWLNTVINVKVGVCVKL